MKIVALIDNRKSISQPNLFSEHGLSVYFEEKDLHCLLDVGATEHWFENALKLGVDVPNIDYLLLSHGHIDHTGGLNSFFQKNSKAKVYASERIMRYKYFSYRHSSRPKDLSPDIETLKANLSRIVLLRENIQLTPQLYLVFNKVFANPLPKGNKFLTISVQDRESPYCADDEIALSIVTPKGLVILSSCSHCGILNIIESCIQTTGINKVAAFVGGLHLIDFESSEDADDVEILAKTILQKYPDMMLYAGHCTGTRATEILSEVLQSHFKQLYCGIEIYL